MSKPRRNIRSKGLREDPRPPVVYPPWRDAYKVEKIRYKNYMPVVEETALGDPEPYSLERQQKYKKRWKMVKPVALAMERMGWDNDHIYWWITSGYQSSTQTIPTEQFAEILLQLDALIEERKTL